jgi:hypothetical protein
MEPPKGEGLWESVMGLWFNLCGHCALLVFVAVQILRVYEVMNGPDTDNTLSRSERDSQWAEKWPHFQSQVKLDIQNTPPLNVRVRYCTFKVCSL